MFVGKPPIAALALCLISCTKTAPPPTVVISSNVPVAGRTAFAVEHDRMPSNALLAKWIAVPTPKVLAFADLRALVRTELVGGLLHPETLVTPGYLTKEAGQCATEWLSAVGEAIGGAGEDAGLWILSYDSSQLKTPLEQCIAAFGGLPGVEVAGAKRAYALGDDTVLAILPDVVLLGQRSRVEASLVNRIPGQWPAAVTLVKGQQAAAIGTSEEVSRSVRTTLSVTNEHFALHAAVEFSNETAAAESAAMLAPNSIQQHFAMMLPVAKPLKDIIDENWHVKQLGKTVQFDFEIDAPPVVVANRLGVLAGLAAYGFRRYVVQAKASEARVTVAEIARRLLEAKPKRLHSLPAVPANFEALRGIKYKSTASDWAPWATIGYSRDDAQYYQYRVDVAKNGKSAEVVAEGDLDGNGKKSRFSLTITIDPKTGALQADSELAELDPTE